MKFDGMNFKRNKALGWRHAEPGDEDAHGVQLTDYHGAHVVIVKVKDCPIQEENGRRYYSAEGVKQHVKLSYSLTHMGYGPWKYQTAKGYRHVFGVGDLNPGDQWKTCTVYLVYDGLVYTSTLKKKVTFEEKLETAAKAVVEAWAGAKDYNELGIKYGTKKIQENNMVMAKAMDELQKIVGY